jgi:hypothetical protein
MIGIAKCPPKMEQLFKSWIQLTCSIYSLK